MLIIAVDPGSCGGVALGTDPENLKIAPYPKTPRDFLQFPRFWNPGSIFVIEKTIHTVLRVPLISGKIIAPKLIAMLKAADVSARELNITRGRWEIASAPWRAANERGTGTILEMSPGTWRKEVFGSAVAFKGSLDWKKAELKKSRELFPWIHSGTKIPKGDDPVYGIAAASLIWYAAWKKLGGKND